MNLETIIMDLCERMARVETKVDLLIESGKIKSGVRLQVGLALFGSATAIGLAIFL